MTPGPRALFQQFSEQISSDNTLSDELAAWAHARNQWQTNWTSRTGSAPEVVLRLLIPNPTSASQDRWVHPVADQAPELDSWTKRWDRVERGADGKALAAVFVRTIAEVESNAACAPDACADLARAASEHGVPLAAFTPALSSLYPSRFVVLCDAWLRVLGHYEGAELPKDISAYPKNNAIALRWLAAAEGDLLAPVFAGCPLADRFGVFSRWVVRTHPGSMSGTRFAVSETQYKEWPPMW